MEAPTVLKSIHHPSMKSYCINLDADTESWQLSAKEFQRVGLPVERISGVVCDNRVLGFNKAVYSAMLAAKGNDLLLFEDDVVFDGSPLIDFRELPEGLLTLHLGANIIGSDIISWQMPTAYNDKYAKLHNAWQSHATYYSKECVDFILDHFPFHSDEYIKEGCQIFDEWLRVNVLSLGRSYLLSPMIAYQRPRTSAIWGNESDYTGAHKQGNSWLKMNL